MRGNSFASFAGALARARARRSCAARGVSRADRPTARADRRARPKHGPFERHRDDGTPRARDDGAHTRARATIERSTAVGRSRSTVHAVARRADAKETTRRRDETRRRAI